MDARGRLLSNLLSGGQAHDCPRAPRLIRRTKRAGKLLGDGAYDSDDLRHWLGNRGTKAMTQTNPIARSPLPSIVSRTSSAIASKMPSVG